MGVNRAVADALEAALEAEPGDLPIRLRLARLYLEGDELPSADRHLVTAVGLAPTDRDCLELAIIVADALGDTSRTGQYRILLSQLDGNTTPATTEERTEDSMDTELRRLVAQARLDRPVTLADVAGMGDVKRQLELSLLGPMRNPELRSAFAVNLRGGLLLWGPPGCGKTYLAKAVAGELGANFIPVAFRQVIDPLIGATERNLHAFFEEARRAAPAVMFFDELDAIGAARTRLHNAAWLHNLVGVLLTELDGMDANDDVYVLGATNQPWDVDPALRRPGRFDRTVLVLPPDPPARKAILQRQLEALPVAGDVQLDALLGVTDGYSGADLVLLCRHAAELAMEDTLRDGGQLCPVSQKHLSRAAGSVSASTVAWLDMARNYALFANQHGEMDGLVAYMRERRLV